MPPDTPDARMDTYAALVDELADLVGLTIDFGEAMGILDIGQRWMSELEKKVNSYSPVMLIRIGATPIRREQYARYAGLTGYGIWTAIRRDIPMATIPKGGVVEMGRDRVTVRIDTALYQGTVRRNILHATRASVSLRDVSVTRREGDRIYYTLPGRAREYVGVVEADPVFGPVVRNQPLWYVGRKFPDEDADRAFRRMEGYGFYLPPKCVLEPEHENNFDPSWPASGTVRAYPEDVRVSPSQQVEAREDTEIPFYTKREGIIGWFSRSAEKKKYEYYYNISAYQTMPIDMPADSTQGKEGPNQFDFFWQFMELVMRKMSQASVTESGERPKDDVPAYSLARVLGGHGKGGPFPGWHKAEWGEVQENTRYKLQQVHQGQGRACNFFVARYGDGPTGKVKPDGSWAQFTRGDEKYSGSLANDPDYQRLCSKSSVIIGW